MNTSDITLYLCVHLTWAGLDYDAHPPPDGIKVQNMEQLKPVKSHAGVIDRKKNWFHLWPLTSRVFHWAAHKCQVCLRQAPNIHASTMNMCSDQKNSFLRLNFISCHLKCLHIIRINCVVGENIQKR